jgi:hypothetical protein
MLHALRVSPIRSSMWGSNGTCEGGALAEVPMGNPTDTQYRGHWGRAQQISPSGWQREHFCWALHHKQSDFLGVEMAAVDNIPAAFPNPTPSAVVATVLAEPPTTWYKPGEMSFDSNAPYFQTLSWASVQIPWLEDSACNSYEVQILSLFSWEVNFVCIHAELIFYHHVLSGVWTRSLVWIEGACVRRIFLFVDDYSYSQTISICIGVYKKYKLQRSSVCIWRVSNPTSTFQCWLVLVKKRMMQLKIHCPEMMLDGQC